jgi:hypothetical protein
MSTKDPTFKVHAFPQGTFDIIIKNKRRKEEARELLRQLSGDKNHLNKRSYKCRLFKLFDNK